MPEIALEPAPATASAVIVEGLDKSFGETPVLRDVDLALARESVLALLGPSGCGKTTLLRCIAGLERPDAGAVRIGGREVAGPGSWIAPERRRVGMVFQDSALFPHMSVARNVAYGLGRGTDRRERRRRVAEALELVGLAGLEDRSPLTLSGGQAQRVALARALAPRPSVLLLDEPFASLDAPLRAQLREEVPRLLREVGCAALFVTHDQHEALQVGDQVAVMLDGRIAQIGTPDAVYSGPASIAVAGFIGDANVLCGSADGTAEATTAIGLVPLEDAIRGPVLIVARPEEIRVEPGGECRVQDVEFYGHDSVYLLACADGTRVRARVLGPPRLGVGDAASAAFCGPAVSAFPGSSAPSIAPTPPELSPAPTLRT